MKSIVVCALALALPARTVAADDGCVPAGVKPQLFVRNGVPGACWERGCVDITTTVVKAKPVEATPVPRESWTAGAANACYGTTCRPLGKRLLAELARRSKLVKPGLAGIEDFDVGITLDHRLAVMIGPYPETLEIWDVARDTTLVVKPSSDHARAQVSLAIVAGNAVIVDWNDGLASVHGLSGQLGSTFRAGVMVALDDKRAAMLGWAGTLSTIDVATGKLTRTDPVLQTRLPFETDVVRLGPQDLALLWEDDGGLTAARIRVPPDAAPLASPLQKLRRCP